MNKKLYKIVTNDDWLKTRNNIVYVWGYDIIGAIREFNRIPDIIQKDLDESIIHSISESTD